MALTREQMMEILAEADPVGLIAGGAPGDEYAREADEILGLRGVPQLSEITSIFSVNFEPGACERETARWIVDEMNHRSAS